MRSTAIPHRKPEQKTRCKVLENQTSNQMVFSFHPGCFLKRECTDRGESLADLAKVLDCTLEMLEQVCAGDAPLTPSMAYRLQHHWDISAGLLIGAQRDFEAGLPWTIVDHDT